VDALRIEERVDVVDRLREPADRATVYTLSAPDIRETAGAFENVLHVLQLLPGVAATNDEDGKLAVRTPEEALAAVLPTCGLSFRQDGTRLIIGMQSTSR
jgi:hypothetical protein